jgi:hypothetical protein
MLKKNFFIFFYVISINLVCVGVADAQSNQEANIFGVAHDIDPS